MEKASSFHSYLEGKPVEIEKMMEVQHKNLY